jgi:SHS2 domain-containing protein
MMKKKYEFINHTADVGIKVWGESLKSLFENTAYSMFDILTELDKVKVKESLGVEIEGKRTDELLADWLRNLLYKFNGEGYLLREFNIEEISKKGLKAKVRGEKLNLSRHTLKTEIKAVTYHGLEVKKTGQGWEAQVIFDV